ncbi:MAG: helix-turn-helix domain-containing protein [Candidatus Kaistia colombiensis]|nr:MAG: helix-turn-helix domain-containing protein [Kaistia sp.]
MGDEIIVSTDMVDIRDRSEFWRELARPIYEVQALPDERARAFEGSVRSRRFGSLLVAATAFSQHEFKRDHRVIARSDLDNYLIQVVTSGTMRGDFGGVSVAVQAGDICIVDLARTFSSLVSTGTRTMISIPRLRLEQAVSARNLHGTVLRADGSMTRLLVTYLTGLRAQSEPLSAAQADKVLEALVALLAAALSGGPASEAPDCVPLRAALRQRTLDFIAGNLHLPELSPDDIARRLNVSRSHLYRAFAEDGGVATVLRHKRLDLALLQLTSPTAHSGSIADVAHRLGFSSANQFLRAFRARFGVTPREVKHEIATVPDVSSPQPDLQNHFAVLYARARS